MKQCPRVPKEDMYMDIHYASEPPKSGGGRRRSYMRGGGETFELLGFIDKSGIDRAAFEAACKEGWAKVRELGRGAFGTVDHIRLDYGEGQKDLVVKAFNLCPGSELKAANKEWVAQKHLQTQERVGPNDYTSPYEEIIEYIIPAFAVGKETIGENTMYYIFFKKEPGRSLKEFMYEKRDRIGPPLTEEQRDDIISDLDICIIAINENGIVHRDIKPENIFVTNTYVTENRVRKLKYKIRLIDFGLGIRTDAPPQHPGSGTAGYKHPDNVAAKRRFDNAIAEGLIDIAAITPESHPELHHKYTEEDDQYAKRVIAGELAAIRVSGGGRRRTNRKTDRSKRRRCSTRRRK